MNLYLLYRLGILTSFMLLLIKTKYKKVKTITIVSIVMILIWVLNSFIYSITNIDFSNIIYPFSVSLPAFLCFATISKTSIIKTLFSFLTVCNFGMLTSCIGLLALYFTDVFIFRIIFEVIVVALIMLLIIYTRKPYFKVVNTLEKGWFLLCSFPLLISGIIYLLMYYPTELNNRPEYIPVLCFVFVLMFSFYIIVYRSFENIAQIYQFRHDRQVILLQTEMQRKEYESIIEKIDAIKIYRHDMRHNISIIHTLIDKGNIQEAITFLNKLNEKLNETIIEQYCENYMINVILSTYITKAKNESIKVNVKTVLPQNLYIDNLELGLIFTNAIENAINACVAFEDYNSRKIDILCKHQNDQIYIQISNPYKGDISFVGDFPVSKIKDHGTGTRSIAAIADKYDGVYSFVAKDGIFKTTVILKNNPGF